MAKVIGKLAVGISAENVRPAVIEAIDFTISDLERWHDIMCQAGHYMEARALEEGYLKPLRESKENI